MLTAKVRWIGSIFSFSSIVFRRTGDGTLEEWALGGDAPGEFGPCSDHHASTSSRVDTPRSIRTPLTSVLCTGP